MMDELEEKDLIEPGFQPTVENTAGSPRYLLPGWEPMPVIEFSRFSRWGEPAEMITGFVGSMQWKLKTREDLEKFLNKTVPAFCELT